MQDRYAGDVGDFGKFGLLKAVEQQGFSIGINWYFTYPTQSEKKQAAGNKPVDEKYSVCDETLFSELRRIFEMPNRSVEELEKRKLLQNVVYYRKPVKIGPARQKWHEEALQTLASAEVTFLDPDNGLITRTTGKASQYAVKYIIDDEIRDYLKSSKAVIFYQHRPREKEEIYFSKMRKRICTICGEIPCQIMSMTFCRVPSEIILSSARKTDILNK